MSDVFVYVFVIGGGVVSMIWMISRSRSRRKIVPILGILAGVWLSIVNIVAYLDGEDINIVMAIGFFIAGIGIIHLSTKDLRKII